MCSRIEAFSPYQAEDLLKKFGHNCAICLSDRAGIWILDINAMIAESVIKHRRFNQISITITDDGELGEEVLEEIVRRYRDQGWVVDCRPDDSVSFSQYILTFNPKL